MALCDSARNLGCIAETLEANANSQYRVRVCLPKRLHHLSRFKFAALVDECGILSQIQVAEELARLVDLVLRWDRHRQRHDSQHRNLRGQTPCCEARMVG